MRVATHSNARRTFSATQSGAQVPTIRLTLLKFQGCGFVHLPEALSRHSPTENPRGCNAHSPRRGKYCNLIGRGQHGRAGKSGVGGGGMGPTL